MSYYRFTQNDTRAPNWNWRGSEAAVSRPALVYSRFTSSVLFLLMRLKTSAVTCRVISCGKVKAFAMRRSVKTV